MSALFDDPTDRVEKDSNHAEEITGSEPGDAEDVDDFIEDDMDEDTGVEDVIGESARRENEGAKTQEQAAAEREERRKVQEQRDVENDLIAHVNDLRASVYADEGSIKVAIDSNIMRILKNILRKLSQRPDLAQQRIGELIILDERLGIIPRLLLPLWQVALLVREIEALELLLLILHKVSILPTEEWAQSIHIDSYLNKLEKLKRDLLVDHLWSGLDLLSTQFRAEMKLDGMTQDQRDLKINVQTLIESLKGRETLPVQEFEVEHGVAASSEDIRTATRLLKASAFLDQLEEKQRIRRSRIERSALALKMLILNLMKIRYRPMSSEDRPQHRLISLLFSKGLHIVFENEWRILIEAGIGGITRSRSSERRDQHGLLLGDDKSILWRNLEFYYQLLQQLSPQACGYFLSKMFLSNSEDKAVVLNEEADPWHEAFEISRETWKGDLLDLSSILGRNSRFNPALRRRAAEQRQQHTDWMSRRDKKRYVPMTKSVHIETPLERLQQGEMPNLASECLIDRECRKEVTTKARHIFKILTEEAATRLMTHLYDFISVAFRRLLVAWLQDTEAEVAEIAAASIARLVNLMTWVLRAMREVMEVFIETWKKVEKGAASTALEQRMYLILGLARPGLDEKAIPFISRKLKEQMKKKAKERSHLQLRCCVRLIVEQQQWGLILAEKAKDIKLLGALGPLIFETHTRNHLPTTLVKLLRDYTSSRAERHFYLLVVTAMQQLMRAASQIPSLQKRKEGRAKVFHKRFGGASFFADSQENGDFDVDGDKFSDNAELSIFVQAVREPKILTKLLHTLAGSAALHSSIVDSVIGLLMCVSEHHWTSTVLAWNLAHTGLFHEILTTKLPSLAETQKMIRKSVYALAEIHKYNRFVAVELLFAQILLNTGCDDTNLMKDYVVPEVAYHNHKTTYGGAWAPRELQKLLSLYEKFKFEGPRRMLRYLRKEMPRRMPDDISLKLASLCLIDKLSAGYEMSSQCFSYYIVDRLKNVVLQEATLVKELAAIKQLSIGLDTLRAAAESEESTLKSAPLKLRLVTSDVLVEVLGVAVADMEEDDDDTLRLKRKPVGQNVDRTVVEDFFPIVEHMSQEDLDALCSDYALYEHWLAKADRQLCDNWDVMGNDLLGILVLGLRTRNPDMDLTPVLALLEAEVRFRKHSLLQIVQGIPDKTSTENEEPVNAKPVNTEEEDHVRNFDWEAFLTQLSTPLDVYKVREALELFGLSGLPGVSKVNRDFPLIALDNRLRRFRGYVKMPTVQLKSVMERELCKKTGPTMDRSQLLTHLSEPEDPSLDRHTFKAVLKGVIEFQKSLSRSPIRARMTAELRKSLREIGGWAAYLQYGRSNDHEAWDKTRDLLLASQVADEEEGEEMRAEEQGENTGAGHASVVYMKEFTTAEFCDVATDDIVRGAFNSLTSNLETKQEVFLYPLGVLKDFIQYQYLMSVLGGLPNEVYQPSEWRWAKAQVNSVLLLKLSVLCQVAIDTSTESLMELRHSLAKKDERVNWESLKRLALQTPTTTPADDVFSDDLFTDEPMEPPEHTELVIDDERKWDALNRQVKERCKVKQAIIDEVEREIEISMISKEDGIVGERAETQAPDDLCEEGDERAIGPAEGGVRFEEAAIRATNQHIWEADEEDEEYQDLFAGAFIGL